MIDKYINSYIKSLYGNNSAIPVGTQRTHNLDFISIYDAFCLKIHEL